ncbi:unnamed protein product [Adineta steineri]|uniref:HP domain-containing protein n=1 Tax=Adineta steineri TaxID=433720 RepID=A0A818JVF4_9BILA|nr:unnamed protein product [Adineta steineri]
MSPTLLSTPSIYDHMINNYRRPHTLTRNITDTLNSSNNNAPRLASSNSKPETDCLLMTRKRKSTPVDEENRRHTVTHITITQPSVRCSASNRMYDKRVPQKPLINSNISSTLRGINPKISDTPSLSSNIEVKPMDFRPLIINGRRRFNTISSSTPMVIIKKKSPSPMNTNHLEQKPLPRSIPVNITSNNTAMVVSTVIPSSLSYSSSCSSSTASATSNNRPTISVPIQVTKTKQNNNIKTTIPAPAITTINITHANQRGYRYIQKQPQYLNSLIHTNSSNHMHTLPPQSNDDDDLIRTSSSSSFGGDVNKHNTELMTDSNVLRLIRRYDPNTAGIKVGRSLENTRGIWHTVNPNSLSSLPSNASSSLRSFLPQRTLSTTYENNEPVRQSSMPRLQRQRAFHEHEPQTSPNLSNSSQAILKYTLPTVHTEFNIQPKKTEPLRIEIEPHVPPLGHITNENTGPYQPLITTGTKRICAAISKSAKDSRLLHDFPSPTTPLSPSTFPVRPSSPRTLISQQQQQENESYRPLLSRSKSAGGIENNEQTDEIDDFDEKSLPITTGSCVNKLKQLFTPKSSLDLPKFPLNKQHRIDSIDSNLDRHFNTNGANINKSDIYSSTSSLIQNFSHPNSIDSQKQSIPNGNLTKPTVHIQENLRISSPLLKRPILQSHKTIDSTEPLSRPDNSNIMPSSELSYDAYRFRRMNDHNQMASTTAARPKNIAKVEPYSINTNTVRPLYPLSSSQLIGTPTTPTTIPSKTRIVLNSVGNTSSNTSASSSAGSLGGTIHHQNVRYSDFLTPNPTFSTPTPLSSSHISQPQPNSSSYIPNQSTSMSLSETLSHGSLQRLPNNNNTTLLHNARSTNIVPSLNDPTQRFRSPTKSDLYSTKQTSSLPYQNGNSTIVNNNKYEQFNNYPPPTSYHYRPRDFASSTSAVNTTSLNNSRPQSQGSLHSTVVEQQQQQDERSNGGQQPRRRFQRRKQMKRSKSADLYQEPSSISSSTKNQINNNYFFPTTNTNEANKHHRQQRSISRDLIGIGGEDENLSSSSTTSSSIAHIERTNRDALLRYKSLDSMTFNNRKLNFNGKTNNTRRAVSKPTNIDYDSDDSVCGIPKPRKLCTSTKNAIKSERTLLDFSSREKNRSTNTQATSIHNIGNSSTSTGITNSIRRDEITADQAHRLVESSFLTQLSSTKTPNGKKERRKIMQHEQQSKLSFTEPQFYARTSNTPTTKRHDIIYPKSNEIHASPPIDDVFHDAINEFTANKDQTIDDKNMPTQTYTDWNHPYEEKYAKQSVQDEELFITEPTDVIIPVEKEKPSNNTTVVNSLEGLRSFDMPKESITPILRRPLKSSVEQMQHNSEDNNDSTTSSVNRSIYLPIEKQRGLSEIIRKRNSRYKVEDYKRSIQKASTFDEQQSDYFRPSTTSNNDYSLSNDQTSYSDLSPRQIKRFNKTKSVDLSMEFDQQSPALGLRRFKSNDRISEEQGSNENNEIDDKMNVAARRNVFETFSKDSPFARSFIRSKSFKQERPPSLLNERKSLSIDKKHDTEEQQQQQSKIENIIPTEIDGSSTIDNSTAVFDDDTSKLTFKEKMILFNKKKNPNSTTSLTLKASRNRLTQPITAEEVLAAEHFSTDTSPTSSSKQLETAPTGTSPTSSSKELETIPTVNDKPLMHDSLSLSLNSSSEEKFLPTKAILQTSILQENRFNQEHVKHPSMHNIDDTTMLSQEEAENMIPVSKRLEQLKTYGENEWKKRIKSTNDANEFTVEGKLRQAGKIPTPTEEQKPLPTSTRKTPTLKYSAKKANTDQQQRAKTVDVVRLKTESIVKNKDAKQTSSSNNKSNGTTSTKSNNNNNVVTVLKSDTVSVLKPDDHFDDFFADSNKNLNNESSIQLNTDDLNRIAENAVRLQSQPARVRPPRRQQQGAKNPLRQIQATISTADEYTEVHTNISEQELRRLKRAQIAENAGLAQEALAALAATENFAEINLRKIDRSSLATFGFEPYKDIMLMLIKGRRHCSLRLVNPIFDSINEGDCYLLITPSKVFAWLGHYANTLEKAKTMDIMDFLKQHRDFGLRSEVKYFVLDQANDDTETDIYAEFTDILHGDDENFKTLDSVIDDDYYEANVMELNRVYRLDNDMLIPLDDFCFRSLSVKILDPNEVFVFDFGSEVYVWNGKYADKTKRNVGLQLAQQLWNDPYDFSECLINPFDPLDDKSEAGNQTGSKRPVWCVFGKQNQNVETLLFKGKFYDWPGDLKELKPINDAANNVNRIPSARRPPSIVEMLKPADVNKMLAKQDTPVNMILEQSNLGRGKHWYDPVELRGHDVQTISLNLWHVSENERHELDNSSYGQFHTDDVYIIRWRYKLVASGFHSIKTGQASMRKTDTGRDRVAYWIWQGINASPNEKGLSALMTVFLDEEKGPHIHVIQEHEEATFLQLFDGTLTIHLGKRNQSNQKKNNWHLYVFLGEIDVENHWWELNIDTTNLRSRTSFLLINNADNFMLLWHGCGTTEEQKLLAHKSAMKLRTKRPDEFHFNSEKEFIEFTEMQEGNETNVFWNAFNEPVHQRKYYSLLNVRSNKTLTTTMRIFHLSSLHGPFVAQELLYPLRSPKHISAFPFTQSDLYDLQQPALCLIDADTELYIWQGWNDLSDDEIDIQLNNANMQAGGPRDIRFSAERRCAFRTAVEYCKTKTGSSTVDLPCSIVYAGLEPIDFINLFPKWTINMKAKQQNQLEGKNLNQKDSVPDMLKDLCREQYTVEELRARPLPEGVDPSKIEFYLSDDDFQKEFHMTKDEYYALPYWKQTNIKKPLGFF